LLSESCIEVAQFLHLGGVGGGESAALGDHLCVLPVLFGEQFVVVLEFLDALEQLTGELFALFGLSFVQL
jgi:hypothetical protein